MGLAVVAEYAVQNLERQIPAFAFSFQVLKEADTLYVMEKRTDIVRLAQIRQKSLAIMSKRRVANVMTQRNSFHQVLVEPQKPGDIAGDFRNQLDM
jgi:hypothetical protein